MIFSPSIHASKNWGPARKACSVRFDARIRRFRELSNHSPGLYYDELLFVPAAMGRHEAFQMPYRRWLGLPIMIFPYIGALKAWIYAPIFRLFGVSALTIRF